MGQPEPPPIYPDAGVVDAEVHLHETPADLAPYCEEPWRRALAADSGQERWLDTYGYSPLTPLDPPRGDYPETDVHQVRDAATMRADLDRLGVVSAVMMPDRFVGLATSRNADYAVSVAAAYNRYLRERWLDPARGLYGAILVPPQDADAAAAEIEHWAGAPGVAAAFLSTVNLSPLAGDAGYDRLFAAAEAAELPVVLHGATTSGNVFPYQLQSYGSPVARGALAQPLAAVANLTSLVTEGTLARHPRLRVLFCEAGLAWLPFLCARLDGQYRLLRDNTAELTELPSAYIRRQVWTSSHPLADVADGAALAAAVEAVGTDRVLYASDWPHFDRDKPTALGSLSEPVRASVLRDNARALFRLG